MSKIVWLTPGDIINIHDEILAMSPGLPGARSVGAVESAVERTRNLAHYEDTSDVVRLAAMLGFSIVVGHAFNDGNKRTALIAVDVFCDLNGHELLAAALDFADKLVGIADGKLTLVQFTGWLRDNTLRR